MVLVWVLQTGCLNSNPPVGELPNLWVQHEPASRPDASTAKRVVRQAGNRVVVDAGIVFCTNPSYLCHPLTRFGLENASAIERIESSCSCVQPSLTRFRNQSGQYADAIRLDFIPEANPAEVQASLLAVELTIHLFESQSKLATVNLLMAGKCVVSPDDGELQ